MTRLFAAVLLLIAVMETASSNQSADPGMHPFLSSKFNLSIGGFLPRKDIKLSARGTLEDDEILITIFAMKPLQRWKLRPASPTP